MKAEMKRIAMITACGLMIAGCHHTEPEAVAPPAQPQTPEVSGVVVHKPFIAIPHPFAPAEGQPSILLQLHARTDSPVPLLEYGKQKTYSLSAFDLRPSLSAEELEKRLGPPAQLADYADPWVVYRLNYGKELWLHFSQPNNVGLLAADIVLSKEDGYTRDRIFSVDGTR
jgi:hypothetical protein